jgi:magnesium chelatase subunit D
LRGVGLRAGGVDAGVGVSAGSVGDAGAGQAGVWHPPGFEALVGMDLPRLALLLVLVEPRLRGVVFAGARGGGKSSVLRGAVELLPDEAPVVLPPGTDPDALTGGLDVEATLRTGEPRFRSGILARAHGGTVLADSLHLLPDTVTLPLLAALEEEQIRVEREGVSRTLPAAFRLLAAFTPEEGMPRAHLLDRIGLIVAMPEAGSAGARAAVIRSHRAGDAEADAGQDAGDDGVALLRGLIPAARELLPEVTISDDQIRRLCALARAWGVQGHRAETFAVRAARASAALALREQVEAEDLELAAQWVLRPRATRAPDPAEMDAAAAEGAAGPDSAEGAGDRGAEGEDPADAPDADRAPADRARPASPPPGDRGPDEPGAGSPDDPDPASTSSDSEAPAELPSDLPPRILEAVAVDLPLLLDRFPFAHASKGVAGSRGTRSGDRGRMVGSRAGGPSEGRIDLLGTLRAAAPFQRLREGLPGPGRIRLRPEDLRIREHRSRAGALFIVAVDASGSMALSRMRQAKGAVHALLAQAYIHRDRVALVAFRGDRADVLLRPTQSVELLRRAVDRLPAGGGTPIARALVASMELAEAERSRGVRQIALVLLTDGRANVGIRAERSGVAAELEQVARGVARSGVRSLVIDTERSFQRQSAAERLARALEGQYFHLPGASGAALAHQIEQAMRG